MVDPTLLNYITAELARGVSQEQLIHTLLTSGWQQSQLDEAFRSTPVPDFSQKPVKIFSEIDFPISMLWIFKYSLIQIPTSLIFLILSIFSQQFIMLVIFSLFVSPFSLISNWLTRKYFKYRTEADFLFLEQGILSKKQYHLPYGVIQHVVVKQDLFDRVFGLASLLIENAAQGAEAYHLSRREWAYQTKTVGQEFVGSTGNRISIPGLKKADAELLRDIILQIIKEHPIDDNASGL